MPCPLCQQRQARRRCPALGRDICPRCCGTKRLVEVACPADCGYLAAAHAHPAASVRRQQERDLAFIMAMRDGLSPTQSDLYWAVLRFLAGFHPDTFTKVVDEDLAEGSASLAATYETASRGLIYEHRPQSPIAQRFVTELKVFLGELAAQGDAAASRQLERDAAIVLRQLERGAREARKAVDEGPATALDTIARFVTAAAGYRDPKGEGSDAPAPSLLVRP